MDPMDSNIINTNIVNNETNNNEVISNNSKKIIVTVLGLLFLVVSVGVGVLMTQRPTQKTGVNAAGANLTLSSNVAGPKVNDTIVIAVAMNTNGLSVTGLDLKLNYDTTKLTATSVQAGPFLPYVFIPGSITSGVVNIVVGCPLDTTGPHPANGTGLVAQVTFTVKAAGTSNITIGTGTKVSASGQTTNMIGVTTPIQITGFVPTPSPTPPPGCHYQQVQCIQAPCDQILVCATPTATPYHSPSPTPTKSPSPSPTSSPSPTPNKTGDVNHDGVVNIVDIGIIIDNYGLSPLPDVRADLNHDGVANIIDIGIIIDNYGL